MIPPIKNKLLFGIIVLAVFLRFVGLFPNIAHPDEGHVQIHSWNLVRNIITDGDFNPHSFKYGSLMFYLQALFYFPLLVGAYFFEAANILISSNFASVPLEFGSFHQEAVRKYGDILLFTGRAQTAIFGVLSVLVVYFIGKKLFNQKVGLLSALFLAIAPLHVRDSHYITTDVLSSFFILLALLLMIYMSDTKRWRWFILSGLIVGLSSTIRYFPAALLVYPIAIFLSLQKRRLWFLKTTTSLLLVPVGIFLGVPFLFLDPQGPTNFMKDLAYISQWYGTAISNYIFALFSFVTSQGKTILPDLITVYPQRFTPIHASFLFFHGFGVLPTIAAIVGVVTTLLVSFRAFLFLVPIPLFTFIYISSYVSAGYERLSIPILPFLAVFAAVFMSRIPQSRKIFQFKKVPLLIIAVSVVALQPFYRSSLATISCQQKDIRDKSTEWVGKNIPDEIKVAASNVSVPSTKIFADSFPLEPNINFSLEEARELGADSAFINAGRLDYETYPYFNNFFIPNSILFENSYYSLALSEYQSRAKLLGRVEKPPMCDSGRIMYYQLPKKLSEQKNLLESFSFDTPKQSQFWHVQNFKENAGHGTLSFNSDIGRAKAGSLEYGHDAVSFTPPRVYSDVIAVKGGQPYTFNIWIKSAKVDKSTHSRVFTRIDFYNKDSATHTRLMRENLKKAELIFNYGLGPVYFEKKREITSTYNDPQLPGKVVALSPRTIISDKFREISVTAEAPGGAIFAILSMQSLLSTNPLLYVDDVEFLGGKQ